MLQPRLFAPLAASRFGAIVFVLLFADTQSSGVASPPAPDDAEVKRLKEELKKKDKEIDNLKKAVRNEQTDDRKMQEQIRERDQQLAKLRKELSDRQTDHRKLETELDALRKRPVVPNDNVALVPYDTSQLFAKEPPSGTGAAIFEFKKGATLLIVRKQQISGKTQWDYATLRLLPDSNTHEIRVNLHKGDWAVYRSNPKSGYTPLGDLKVGDKPVTIAIPDTN